MDASGGPRRTRPPRRRSSPARRRCCGRATSTASVSALKRRPPQTSQSTFTSGRKLISIVCTPWPSQASQRPPARVEREPRRAVAAHPRLGRAGEELADRRPRSRRRSPGRSAASCRSASGPPRARARSASTAVDARAADPLRRACAGVCFAVRDAQVRVQHVARQRGLARPRHAGHDREAAERNAHVHLAQVVQARLARCQRRRRRAVTGRRARERVPQRLREEAAGQRLRAPR